MSAIRQNLQVVRQRIATVADSVQRDVHGIELLAVSKTFAAGAVIEAAEAGQLAFGENYLQEALDKITTLRTTRPDLNLEWHFIGPIQSNKTRAIAEHFDWVHSVDREKIAQRLAEQRPPHLPSLNICLQVNISGEPSKSGVLPSDAIAVAQAIAGLPRIRLRGLMAIPQAAPTEMQQRAPFHQLHALFDRLNSAGLQLDTLSMGMSDDMAAAIAEGATIVRIGSAIFGTRNYAK